MYYFGDYSRADIGRHKNLTRERIRQILNSAIKKLIKEYQQI